LAEEWENLAHKSGILMVCQMGPKMEHWLVEELALLVCKLEMQLGDLMVQLLVLRRVRELALPA